MTKKRLSRMRFLRAEIDRLSGRILEIESMAARSTTIITGMPKCTADNDLMVEYLELKNKLTRVKRRRMREWNRMYDYISAIDDSVVRQIFELRYIDGMTWEQVAQKTPYSERQLRRIHNRYLNVQ